MLSKINLTTAVYYNAWKYIKRQNSSKQLIELQNIKLQNLILYCYKNIKYYRELFDKHYINPAEIKTAEDLSKIPVLTKQIFRQRFWDFLPRELPACRLSRTSGSTGIPVCILSDRNSRLFNSAAVIRYRKALSIPVIGKAILTPLKTPEVPFKKSHWTFLQGLHKTYYINPYICDTEYDKKMIAKLAHPAIIGITPAVSALACKIRDGILPPIHPVAVLTTGQYLSPSTRKLLEETFGTKINDIYACNEAGDIAWQCNNGLYHINTDNCIVEILKDDKPVSEAQIGEVAITNLNRYSMPFIRYKNGDLARFADANCKCRCKLPVISEITGRTGQDILLPDDRVIAWNQLKGFMNHPLIRQFQLIQNRDASLTIKVIPETDSSISDIKNALLPRFKKLLADVIKINLVPAKTIAPASSGKNTLVICNYQPSLKK